MRDDNRIGGYMYNPMFRGYLNEKWSGTPLAVVDDEMEVHEVLDCITDAVERGRLTRDGWPEELFASLKDMHAFIEMLPQEYDDIFRIVDRWWFALSALLNRPDEEEFITGSHIAHAFGEEYAELLKRRSEAATSKPAAKAKKKAKA